MTIVSGYKNSCRRWFGVMWLMLEMNLIAGTIFGFAALFKILPDYGVYNYYCVSTTNITIASSGQENCDAQTRQYQNALTLGIAFFDLPSVIVGTLIDKSRAVVSALFAGATISSTIWFSVFQRLIDDGRITLEHLSYIWMSFGLLMLISSFLFLDWKFTLWNLPYGTDVKLEQPSTIPSELTDRTTAEVKWYSKIYQRTGVWSHLLSPVYILVVLFLSILLLPSILLSVTWYPWVYYITNQNTLLGKLF
ncbi:unnamed protein product [Adineta ricciae]|uniref:Uncharacterized protein n=1 Tax=Adineta ricciae TaxID=249248 RepID=A0A815NJP3_ADIRI|nr:unnamed protein product [Adineta ricciae]